MSKPPVAMEKEAERVEIRVTALTVRYRKLHLPVLDALYWTAGVGMHVLLGPQGAGKSTLLRVLAGQLPPAHGRVLVADHDVAKQAQGMRADVGYLPSCPRLPGRVTVRQWLGRPTPSDAVGEERVAEVVDLVGLPQCLDSRLGRLPIGPRRRAALARELVRNPRVLLLDEPTAGLDPLERARMQAILRRVARSTCVVMATNSLGDAVAVGGHGVVLFGGRILAAFPMEDLAACARGQVWEVRSEPGPGPYRIQGTPDSGVLRLVGTLPPGIQAKSVEPTVEDGYLLLLLCAREEAQLPV